EVQEDRRGGGNETRIKPEERRTGERREQAISRLPDLPASQNTEKIMRDALFEKGLKLRKRVIGAEYVERSLATPTAIRCRYRSLPRRLPWGSSGRGLASLTNGGACSTSGCWSRSTCPMSSSF